MADSKRAFDDGYEALQTGRAFIELVDWTSISVVGADRQKFLHNFSTNDVKRLAPGASCEAFFTNVKGKIVGHGLIDCRDGELVIIGAPGQGPKLIEHLERYVIREDVAFHELTGDRRYLLVAGELPVNLDCRPICWRLLDRDNVRLLEVGADQFAAVVSRLVSAGFIVAGDEAFSAVRIESVFPLFGIDFDEENLPQEIGRDRQAISFTKGCYLGQETVARIDALGHVNRMIVQVRFMNRDVRAESTDLTRDSHTVGRITSVAYSPKHDAPIALAMVRRDATSAGTRLESSVGPCEVVAR